MPASGEWTGRSVRRIVGDFWQSIRPMETIAMPKRPIVIIHGYSDKGESFRGWRDLLVNRLGYDPSQVHICSYRSLTNEISIKDIAEGFDRALRLQTSLKEGQAFDAIVHSTGMLVIRAWLTQYGAAQSPLRNLIALAPATFGSPLAHKGRSFIGSVFKGDKNLLSPDFMEAGDEVLFGLELGSRFTWDLAHRDLFGDDPFYGPTKRTPYVFVFCGTKSYGGIRKLINEPGTDGTVRWAGTPLNSRKFILDLTERRREANAPRAKTEPFRNVDIDFIPIEGKDHGSIVKDPGDLLIDLVEKALAVDSAASFEQYMKDARKRTKTALEGLTPYQQFIIRAVDERGDAIPDWNLQFFVGDLHKQRCKEFAVDVHVFARDKSLRCFHVKLDDLGDLKTGTFMLKVIATTGTDFVSYYGTGSEMLNVAPGTPGKRWDAQIMLQNQIDADTTLFHPFTTTLIEIVLNREPMPLDYTLPNEVTRWLVD